MSDPIVVTRDKVRREWSDFEPKLVAALLSGGGAAVVTAVLTPIAEKMGLPLDQIVVEFIVLGIAGLVGWITPSMGTTVTKQIAGNGTVSETHSGNPVSTITAPTKIQRVQIQQTSPGVFTTEPAPEPEPLPAPAPENQPTEILPPSYSRGQSILDQLGKDH